MNEVTEGERGTADARSGRGVEAEAELWPVVERRRSGYGHDDECKRTSFDRHAMRATSHTARQVGQRIQLFVSCRFATLGLQTRPVSTNVRPSVHMHALTTSSDSCAAAYDEAVHQYLTLSRNPVTTLAPALAADPGFLVAHALTSWLYLLGTGITAYDKDLSAPLCASRELVMSGVGTPRERAIAIAADAWANGHQRYATAILEASLIEQPTDALVLRLLHDAYYIMGDSLGLRDSPARTLQNWDPSMPEYGRVIGMAAFGFEENGQYARAEELAMQALGDDSSDVWAMHAALHCYEMTARLNEGGRLIRETREVWEAAELFDHHVKWHWCLLNLEGGEFDIATSRYDTSMAGDASRPSVFSAGDAAALLWRMDLLHRKNLCPPLASWAVHPRDPGPNGDSTSASRWADVLRRLRPHLGQHTYPFNDVHIALALAGAGETEDLAAHIDSMQDFATTDDEVASGLRGTGTLTSACTQGQGTPASSSVSRTTSEGRMQSLSSGFSLDSPQDRVRGSSLRHRAELSLHSRDIIFAPTPSKSASQQLSASPMPNFGGHEGSAHSMVHALPQAPHQQTPLIVASQSHDVRAALRVAGIAVAQGIAAFAAGDTATAMKKLLSSKPQWSVLGGSAAQRDVLDQTLIHAAVDCGELTVARALLSQRATARFASPMTWYMLSMVHEALGDIGRAMDTRHRAAALGLGQGGGGGRRRL